MKFIFDGGYNKKDENSIKNNVFTRYNSFLLDELKKYKKLLIITSAKPIGHYKDRIEIFVASGADVIERDFENELDWGKYDFILVLGGENEPLVNQLYKLHFSLDKLKSNMVYIGCSAGSMIMSSYYYDYSRNDKENVIFQKGLVPENKEIYIVHSDNLWYTDEFLKEKIQKFAEENNLLVVEIKENEVVEREF